MRKQTTKIEIECPDNWSMRNEYYSNNAEYVPTNKTDDFSENLKL